MKKPKVLYINKNQNLSAPIIKGMKDLEMDVHVLIDEKTGFFDKAKPYHKFQNIFHRIFLKDKTYFQKAEKQQFEKDVENLKLDKDYDFAFFIRGDMYSEKFIKKVKKVAKTVIDYQWDGLEMYPKIFDRIKYFDRFFAFDPTDIQKFPQYKILPLPIYHYTKKEEVVPQTEILHDFFYVGVGLDDRIKWIKNLEKYSLENHLKLKAILTINNYRPEEKTEMVSLQHSGISLAENEIFTSKSKAVIDFKMPTHEGLAFRFFECLRKEQKFITNNKTIVNYDFYHPNNIFICDFENFEGLKEFLEKPYQKIDEEIVSKYGIENWLKYVFNLEGHRKIDLPKI